MKWPCYIEFKHDIMAWIIMVIAMHMCLYTLAAQHCSMNGMIVLACCK